MRVALIGANGQLGCDIARALSAIDSIGDLNDRVLIPLTHTDIEITDFKLMTDVLSEHKPDIVINTAAYHRVDDCETNLEKAFSVNALGARNLALHCKENKICLLHISTDYVFDGKRTSPYVESDLPNPLNAYGVSKLAGEHFVRSITDEHFIVRTSGLYGIHKCRAKGGNFIDTMLRLSQEQDVIRVVDDEVLTPTYTLDVAYQIRELLETGTYGTYHITNQGECSWYEFASKIFEFMDIQVNLERITADEFRSPARRPSYSVLENKALKDIGIDRMRSWDEALNAYLQERKEQHHDG